MQVPSARIIELINNVALRGMAVIKEPRLYVLRCRGLLRRLSACVCECVFSFFLFFRVVFLAGGLWGGGGKAGGCDWGTADAGTHSGMQPFDSLFAEAERR